MNKREASVDLVSKISDPELYEILGVFGEDGGQLLRGCTTLVRSVPTVWWRKEIVQECRENDVIRAIQV